MNSGFADSHVDQAQYLNDVDFHQFNDGPAAQSFKQDHANISGASVFLFASTDINASPSGTVTASLFDTLGGSPILSASGLGTAGSWLDIYWPAVAIVPSQTYYLVFTSPDSNLHLAGMEVITDPNFNGGLPFDPYDKGNAFTTSGFVAWDGNDAPGPGADLAFMTHYDDGTRTPTHNTPDGGSTLAILGLSFTLLGIVRSKR